MILEMVDTISFSMFSRNHSEVSSLLFYVSCCRGRLLLCCIFLFFQKLQMFVISFKHCLNSKWKITAFGHRDLSLALLRRITAGLEERVYRRQSGHQSSTEHTAWLHLEL